MADIVAVCRFCEAGSSTFSGYISYIDRDKATRKSSQNSYNIFSHYMDYMDNDAKTVADQTKQTERVSALFTKDLDVLSGPAKKEVRKVFKSAQRRGSNMWQTVISFDNAYLQRQGLYDMSAGVLNEAQLRQAARKAVAGLLKRENLEHAVWTGAFHYNTDNIHIHIAIVEPQPIRDMKTYTIYAKDKNGDVRKDADGNKVPLRDEHGQIMTRKGYRGMFKNSSIKHMKSMLRAEIETNKEAYKEITKLMREDIQGGLKSRNLMDIPEFTDLMAKLHRALVSSHVPRRYWDYNQHRLMDIRDQIDQISDCYMNCFHSEDLSKLLSKLQEEQERQTKAYGGSGSRYKENMLYGKDGLYARLGNVILKQISTYDRMINEQISCVKTLAPLLDPESRDYDPKAAIRRLELLAQAGNTYAQSELGLIYLKGEHRQRNVKKAMEYFRQSSEGGNEFGERMLKRISERRDVFTGMDYRYKAQCKRTLQKGFRLLEHNLKNAYDSFRNQQEAELLQAEIRERGEQDL